MTEQIFEDRFFRIIYDGDIDVTMPQPDRQLIVFLSPALDMLVDWTAARLL